jgi:hypothetical protein
MIRNTTKAPAKEEKMESDVTGKIATTIAVTGIGTETGTETGTENDAGTVKATSTENQTQREIGTAVKPITKPETTTAETLGDGMTIRKTTDDEMIADMTVERTGPTGTTIEDDELNPSYRSFNLFIFCSGLSPFLTFQLSFLQRSTPM